MPVQKLIIETLSSSNTLHDKDSWPCVAVHISSMVQRDGCTRVAVFLIVFSFRSACNHIYRSLPTCHEESLISTNDKEMN